MRFGEIRFDPQGLLIMTDRFPGSVLLRQGDSKIVVGFSEIGFDPQSLFEVSDRFFRPAVDPKGGSQVVLGQPGIGILRQRVAPEGFEVVVGARLSPGSRSQQQ